MDTLLDKLVDNRPDKTFENLQENQLDNIPDHGPISIKYIFQVVKKPERTYQTRMGKRNVMGKEPGRMARMGKVNTSLKIPR